MSVHAFRFDQFHAHVRNAFSAPRKPRHRALRVVLGLVGVAVLAVLVMLGLFVGAAMIVAGLLFRLWKQRGKPIANRARDSRLGRLRTLEVHARLGVPAGHGSASASCTWVRSWKARTRASTSGSVMCSKARMPNCSTA